MSDDSQTKPPCIACGREPGFPPKDRRQTNCPCRGSRLDRAREAAPTTAGDGDEAATSTPPMGAVAKALADALVDTGWDGTATRIGGAVCLASGELIGDIDIVIRPRDCVIRGDKILKVTPAAFIATLRRSWRRPAVTPPPPPSETPSEPAEVGEKVVKVKPYERFRVPFPWEKTGGE